MIKKKTVAAAVAAAALLLPLTSCSSGGGLGSNDTAAAARTSTVDPAVAKAAKNFKGTFTYWTGLTFPDEGNQIEQQQIEKWGKDLGIKVEVVAVNQNDTSKRVAAALQSGSMPDALTVGYDLSKVMAASHQLAPLDATYKAIGKKHGGWFTPIDTASTDSSWGGSVYGIPLGFFGNILFQRDDLLSKAGVKASPKTWKEFAQDATAITKAPNVYGAGLSVSNVLDGNLMTAIMQSFGGRVADDAGKKCTIDSPATKQFLTWVSDLYHNKVIPPDAVTWDGAGDNNAYLSGAAGFIVNTGSVYLSMVDQDPDLEKSTRYSTLPSGPAMTVNPVDIRYRVVPASTDASTKVLAEDLFKVLSEDSYNKNYMAKATYGPVLKSQASYPIFADTPAYGALLKIAKSGGTAPAYPDVANTAYSEYQNTFSTPHMIQRVVTDGLSVDKAAAEAQVNCQKIYDKYNK